MMNNIGVICLEIIICLGKNVFIFLEQFDESLFLSWEQFLPRLTFCGVLLVPRLITSNCMDELFVLQFVTFLNLSWRS
jgi:hypothetical protein